jgi:hypothetical protein
MKRTGFLVILLFAFAACVVPSLQGQTQSQLTGTVSDNTGAVVPNAEVQLRNTNTGVILTTKTNSSGIYTFLEVQAGSYEAICEFPGFKKIVRGGIILETGSRRALNLILEVGNVTESVEVTASIPLLETQTNNVGQLIERANVENMPLQSRRAAGLVRMMGNVLYRPGSDNSSEAAPIYTIAGGRAVNQMTLLDGGSVQNMTLGVPQQLVNPPAEALQEFKISASNHSAEFGRAGSGLVLMTTRSGTNEYHGAGYWFVRNDKLDARNFFAREKGPLKYNIFGASIGGPIKKDRSFFFFNYEGTRRRTGQVFAGNAVPHPENIRGDFSARTDVRVLDPTTGVQFPNNIIPASRVSPLASKLLAYYPAPNGPGDNSRAPANNYVGAGSDALDQESFIGRWDHTLNESHRLFVSASYLKGIQTDASIFPQAIADSRAQTKQNSNITITGNVISNLGPTLVNEFRATYGRRTNETFRPGTTSGVNGQLGIQGVDPEGFPIIGMTGLTGLSGNHRRIQLPIMTYQAGDSVTWVKGTHTIKFGGEFRYSMNTDINQPSSNGQYNFSNRATNEGLATFLLGWTTRLQRNETLPLEARSDFWGAYIQDEWRVAPKLTLTLGMRWDMDTPRWERSNRQSGFDGSQVNPVSGTAGIATFAGIDGVSKYSHDFDANNLGPRIGLSYQLTPKTVVRGGYGIYYNGIYELAVANSQATGFGVNLDMNSTDGGYTPVQKFGDPVPAAPQQKLWPGYGAVPVGSAATTSLDFIQKNQVNGYMQHLNFSVQRELVNGLLVEVTYMGNIGKKLGAPSVNRNVIPLVNGMGPARQDQRLRLYPQYSNVSQISPVWGDSAYHSMNLKVEKRYAGGLSFLTNFTWSKYLTNADAGGWREIEDQRVGYQHPDLRKFDWSISNSNIPLRLVSSVMYELPFGKGRSHQFSSGVTDAILGGWGIGGILELRDGPAYGIVEQTDLTNTFGSGQRPNIVGQPLKSGWSSRDEVINAYFNTTAFAAPGTGIFGNAPRNIGYAPGLVSLDVSVHKRWRLTERFGLSYRCDFFNLPNRPNFGAPNTARGSAAFGTIRSAYDPRILQMNLRLEF